MLMVDIKDAIKALKANAGKYLNPEGLKIYSPKFLALYENIIENAGLHLIYSQFRTLEGIGIFSMVLDQNGFAQFKLAQDKDNIWKKICIIYWDGNSRSKRDDEINF